MFILTKTLINEPFFSQFIDTTKKLQHEDHSSRFRLDPHNLSKLLFDPESLHSIGSSPAYSVRIFSHPVYSESPGIDETHDLSSLLTPEELTGLKEGTCFPLMIPYFCKTHKHIEYAKFLEIQDGYGDVPAFALYSTPEGYCFSQDTMIQLLEGNAPKDFWTD